MSPILLNAAPILDSGNTAWIMVSTVLVLLMTIPGIALFYGGLVRQKNVLSIIMQSLLIVGVVSILWVLFGYSFVFGLFASYVYLKGFGLVGSTLLHFLFNLLNGYLFSSLGGQNSGLAFYAANLVVGAMLIAYLVMLILLDIRKEKSRR